MKGMKGEGKNSKFFTDILRFVFIIFFVSSSFIYSEDIEIFKKTYNSNFSEVGNCLTEYEGNYYLAGNAYSDNDILNPCIIKTDKRGNLIWKKVISRDVQDSKEDEFYFDYFNGIVLGKDGIFVSSRKYLYMIDPDGNTVSKINYSFNSRGIIINKANKLIAYGGNSSIYNVGSEQTNIGYKVNTDTKKYYKNNSWQECYIQFVSELKDQGYILVEFNEEKADVSLKRIKYDGTIIWALICPHESINTLLVLPDSNLIVTGMKRDRKSNYITKFNSDGEVLWENELNLSYTINSIILDDKDNIMITGYIKSKEEAKSDVFLMELTYKGELSWVKIIQERLFGFANNIIKTSDGGIALLGGTNSFSKNGNYEFYFIKFGKDGAGNGFKSIIIDGQDIIRNSKELNWFKYTDYFYNEYE